MTRCFVKKQRIGFARSMNMESLMRKKSCGLVPLTNTIFSPTQPGLWVRHCETLSNLIKIHLMKRYSDKRVFHTHEKKTLIRQKTVHPIRPFPTPFPPELEAENGNENTNLTHAGAKDETGMSTEGDEVRHQTCQSIKTAKVPVSVVSPKILCPFPDCRRSFKKKWSLYEHLCTLSQAARDE